MPLVCIVHAHWPLLQGKTSPPGYLTESDLIGLMERHGIGTDASMATHINNILERNYAQVQAGRTVVPTELGITLVRGYQLIDAELCSPQVTPGTPKRSTASSNSRYHRVEGVFQALMQPLPDKLILATIFRERNSMYPFKISAPWSILRPSATKEQRREER